MTPPWSLYSWPAVFCQANPGQDWHFVHLGTRVMNSGSAYQPATGQTVWAECTLKREAGLAWDWVQICEGVVAMMNPMSVVTNLRLIGDRGQVLTAGEAALHLSRMIHRLPWQSEVLHVLRAV